MRTSPLVLASLIVVAVAVLPTVAEAKKLKPKYYKACYENYAEMRKAVPEPAFDVAGAADTVNAVAGIAGRFGGFGGSFGSVASTASTAAKHAETIADVAAFTESMTQSFPDPSTRYAAYGERMAEEAKTMHQVADSAMTSQTCYAEAYAALALSAESGDMKSKTVKKHHEEITLGVANIMTVLNDGAQYMDTNIGAYDEAMTQETVSAGLDLGGLASLAGQAQGLTNMVGGLSAGSVPAGSAADIPSASPDWARGNQAALVAQAQVLGVSGSVAANPAETTSMFSGLSSLSSLATLGSIDPAMAGSLVAQQALGHSATANGGAPETTPPGAANPDQQVAALMKAGQDIQPYLQAYERIKTLSSLQQAVSQKVSQLP